MTTVFESIDAIKIEPPDGGIHISVGTFDGVHLAHARLLGRVAGEAHATNGQAMVFTFQNHPRAIINPDFCPKILTPWPLKKKLLCALPFDYIVGIEFDPEFSRMPAENFIRDILVGKCHGRTIHSGKNFRFGKGGFGGPGMLEELSRLHGYRYEQLELLMRDDRRISSTRIREHLEQCEIRKVTDLLARSHQVTAPIITGDQIGRTIQFPTANLDVPETIAMPGHGVYAGRVRPPGESDYIPAMANYGKRPTVKGTETRFEVHLIDWDGELGGQELTFEFLDYLRPVQKFDGLQELKAQLAMDKESSLGIFHQYSENGSL